MPVVEYKSLIEIEVERLFREHPPVYDEYCINPVTHAGYVGILDSTRKQKEEAGRALLAREWFSINGPRDLQPLPLNYSERERLKHGGADHILAWYARSLDNTNFDVTKHPSFYDYACGVMCSEFTAEFVKNDEGLKKRFPPRKLDGLGPGLQWEPPKGYAKVMKAQRRPRRYKSQRAKRAA